MFRHCSKIRGYRLGATDGEIGKVEDFFFDDRTWAIRYLVADTGYWLSDRLVLISPHALKQVDDENSVVSVSLGRQQIESSPPITADQPVSRQYEQEYFKYYGWPGYWTGPSLWGPGPYPLYFAPLPPPSMINETQPEPANPHLRSVKELVGYHIQARDGEIGHVADLVVEDATWAIRYLVVDTRNWLPGKKVLVAPPWIENVSWERSMVVADLPRALIEQAPPYDSEALLTRDYEVSLFKHYSREGYWGAEAPRRDVA
ncbi:MAG: PRC-barrel domain-containing protein [Verrucomicrobiota bacterium]